MQEEADSGLMHVNRFRKGQGFTHEAAESLMEGVVETRHIIGAPRLGEQAS